MEEEEMQMQKGNLSPTRVQFFFYCNQKCLEEEEKLWILQRRWFLSELEGLEARNDT